MIVSVSDEQTILHHCQSGGSVCNAVYNREFTMQIVLAINAPFSPAPCTHSRGHQIDKFLSEA